jgi:hypothetical protein
VAAASITGFAGCWASASIDRTMAEIIRVAGNRCLSIVSSVVLAAIRRWGIGRRSAQLG